MESNDVPDVIAGRLPRPVFFGDEGSYLRAHEIDAFEDIQDGLLRGWRADRPD
jgi:hypothetical protein